jgi:hypothetical protein
MRLAEGEENLKILYFNLIQNLIRFSYTLYVNLLKQNVTMFIQFLFV